MTGAQAVQWKDRGATLLSNGVVQLTTLNSGGHLAEFRFVNGVGPSSVNALWEAPWQLRDPAVPISDDLGLMYGPPEIRKFIAGFTGHALCLDYFGAATPQQFSAGLSLHGEAANLPWTVLPTQEEDNATCKWRVRLPWAKLGFERQIHLAAGENTAYVHESVTNENKAEHEFDWVQHVTFGSPLLQKDDSTLIASAQNGITSPTGYDADSLLAADRDFVWPFAPLQDKSGFADLRQPFAEKGKGFIAGVQLDAAREIEYVLAVNWKTRLGVGYCFRRRDFPWMTLWEENEARRESPWNGTTRARGMEFGTAPLPTAGDASITRAIGSEIPRRCVIPAFATKVARYVMFLFAVPNEVTSIQSVEVRPDAIELIDDTGSSCFSLPAKKIGKFLEAGERA